MKILRLATVLACLLAASSGTFARSSSDAGTDPFDQPAPVLHLSKARTAKAKAQKGKKPKTGGKGHKTKLPRTPKAPKPPAIPDDGN